MNKQINLIKESGLPISKVAEITAINYKKLYRVVNNGAELRFSEVQKLQILNEYIKTIKIECASI